MSFCFADFIQKEQLVKVTQNKKLLALTLYRRKQYLMQRSSSAPAPSVSGTTINLDRANHSLHVPLYTTKSVPIYAALATQSPFAEAVTSEQHSRPSSPASPIMKTSVHASSGMTPTKIPEPPVPSPTTVLKPGSPFIYKGYNATKSRKNWNSSRPRNFPAASELQPNVTINQKRGTIEIRSSNQINQFLPKAELSKQTYKVTTSSTTKALFNYTTNIPEFQSTKGSPIAGSNKFLKAKSNRALPSKPKKALNSTDIKVLDKHKNKNVPQGTMIEKQNYINIALQKPKSQKNGTTSVKAAQPLRRVTAFARQELKNRFDAISSQVNNNISLKLSMKGQKITKHTLENIENNHTAVRSSGSSTTLNLVPSQRKRKIKSTNIPVIANSTKVIAPSQSRRNQTSIQKDVPKRIPKVESKQKPETPQTFHATATTATVIKQNSKMKKQVTYTPVRQRPKLAKPLQHKQTSSVNKSSIKLSYVPRRYIARTEMLRRFQRKNPIPNLASQSGGKSMTIHIAPSDSAEKIKGLSNRQSAKPTTLKPPSFKPVAKDFVKYYVSPNRQVKTPVLGSFMHQRIKTPGVFFISEKAKEIQQKYNKFLNQKGGQYIKLPPTIVTSTTTVRPKPPSAVPVTKPSYSKHLSNTWDYSFPVKRPHPKTSLVSKPVVIKQSNIKQAMLSPKTMVREPDKYETIEENGDSTYKRNVNILAKTLSPQNISGLNATMLRLLKRKQTLLRAHIKRVKLNRLMSIIGQLKRKRSNGE